MLLPPSRDRKLRFADLIQLCMTTLHDHLAWQPRRMSCELCTGT